MSKIIIEVVNDDAITYQSDILVLKYAQNLYGLDRAIVSIFERDGLSIQSGTAKGLQRGLQRGQALDLGARDVNAICDIKY